MNGIDDVFKNTYCLSIQGILSKIGQLLTYAIALLLVEIFGSIFISSFIINSKDFCDIVEENAEESISKSQPTTDKTIQIPRDIQGQNDNDDQDNNQNSVWMPDWQTILSTGFAIYEVITYIFVVLKLKTIAAYIFAIIQSIFLEIGIIWTYKIK
jgi:hypothetical protein